MLRAFFVHLPQLMSPYTYRIPVGRNGLLNFVPACSSALSRRGNNPYNHKSTACVTWTHKFVCLASTTFDRVPSAQEKYVLKCAGLEEKKVVLRLDGSWDHIKEKLLEEFPALTNAGGFELLWTDGPYSRSLVTIDTPHLAGVSNITIPPAVLPLGGHWGVRPLQ